MSLENNFSHHSKEYIFLDNETLLNQREQVFKKIIQKNYDKKNNESLKNITISDLEKFDYFYKPKKEDPTVSIIDNYNYEIRVVNGQCKNYEDDNIEIRNAKKVTIQIKKNIKYNLLYDQNIKKVTV